MNPCFASALTIRFKLVIGGIVELLHHTILRSFGFDMPGRFILNLVRTCATSQSTTLLSLYRVA